ncbi:hypothetical protein D9M71_648290 [compost metagenome]
MDGQAVAGSHAQHQRTRTLVRTQADLAGHRGAATAERHAAVVHHVLAQGIHHAVHVLRAHAVKHQWLIERDHVGDQIPRATGGCLRLVAFGCAEQQRQGHHPFAAPPAQEIVPGRLLMTVTHGLPSPEKCCNNRGSAIAVP